MADTKGKIESRTDDHDLTDGRSAEEMFSKRTGYTVGGLRDVGPWGRLLKCRFVHSTMMSSSCLGTGPG